WTSRSCGARPVQSCSAKARTKQASPSLALPNQRSGTNMITSLEKPRIASAAPRHGSEAMVKFGVVGYGYWGPNVVRNLDRLEEAEVVAVCDKSASARRKVAKAYPDVRVTDK